VRFHRGLHPDERRILLPGPPGEAASDFTIQQLVRDGRARWDPHPDGGTCLNITAMGALALRVCPLNTA